MADYKRALYLDSQLENTKNDHKMALRLFLETQRKRKLEETWTTNRY